MENTVLRRELHSNKNSAKVANRVVITGIGIWSCIGTNVDEVKKSLYEGRSGIGIDEERSEYGYRSALTGIFPSAQS